MGRQKKKCKDHLGNEYNSIAEMCKAYGIDNTTYCKRLERGFTLEEALTRNLRNYKCKDHLGNEYNSIAEMCKAYGLTETAYCKRLKRGFTLEEALTTPKYCDKITKVRCNAKKCKDHLGNEYNSITEMCKAYGIKNATYRNRIVSGLSLEEALSNKKYATDHKGNKYNSIAEMCKAYGIKYSTYIARIERGLTVEEALTNPIRVGCYPPKVDSFSLNIINFIKSKCNNDRELYKLESKLGISVTKSSFTIEDGIKVANYFNVDFNKLIGCSPTKYKKLKSKFVDILRYFQYLNADFSDDICNFIDTVLPEMEKEIFGEESDNE